MKRIYDKEAKAFYQNYVEHLANGTLRVQARLNGDAVPVRKWFLPESEFPELSGPRTQPVELIPGAKADGTFVPIFAYTMETGEVFKFEFIGACPPCCAKETIIQNTRLMQEERPYPIGKDVEMPEDETVTPEGQK